MPADLTVVIPFYNRADMIGHPLESIHVGRRDLQVETLLIDDGSTPPATEVLRDFPHPPDRIIRQENQGLLFARLTGLLAATGEFVTFLDSDDLVSPDKFTAQVSVMRRTAADVSYTDSAEAELLPLPAPIVPRPVEAYADTTDPAVFFIRVQPAPHSPVFRTAWLRAVVENPLFPPSPLYNPVAEIWFYHIAAPRAAKVARVAGPHAIVGHHPGIRITNHWEKLAVASLAVMEAFMRACPVNEATRHVRQLVGEQAFSAWRRLPYGFDREFDRRMLSLWQQSPRGDPAGLGGPFFRRIAGCLGPVNAGRLLRRVRGNSYQSTRTLDDPRMLVEWLKSLPST